MFKKVGLLTTLLASATLTQAADFHIADDVQLFMHSGPSYEYRITGRVRSGEPVTVLEKSGDYTKIELEGGRTGWVPNRYLAEGDSELLELPILREALAARESSVDDQANEIAMLRSRLETLQVENEQYTQDVVQRDAQIRDLQFEIQNMDQSNLMRWLTHGGLIALGGVILGLIIPNLPKRRKPRDDWF